LRASATDAALLAAAAEGDKRAFEQIYLKYKDDLLTVAAHVLGDRTAAEDVVHDVFVALAKRAGQLAVEKELKGYLLTSCVNRVRDGFRRKARERRLHDAMDVPPERPATPEQLVEIADETGRVSAALASLTPKQREVVALRIHGGLKFREIAAMLEAPTSTVKSRYHYALTTLKHLLGTRGIDR
jgi:RNA polymerase sigma-70 factor (ECF subfamily)